MHSKTLQEFESFYQSFFSAQENSKEAFVWFSGIPHFLFNAVMHLSDANRVEDLIKLAPKDVPISFWVHSQNKAKKLIAKLKEKGFQPLLTCPLMTWKVRDIHHQEVDMRKAENRTFQDILAEVFQFNSSVKDGYSRLLLSNNSIENYLLYYQDKPAGTGSILPQGSLGGIFNVSLLPEFQKKGLGKLMMHFLQKRAFDLNLEKLILLSSPELEKLYLDLHFERNIVIEIYSFQFNGCH